MKGPGTSQQRHERAKEDSKDANERASAAARSAILINGGAATATLAFLSNVAKDAGSLAKSILLLMPIPLSVYACGVFAGSVALLALARSLGFYKLGWENPGHDWPARGVRYWWAAFGLICLGLICFLGASLYLAWGLSRI
jgi:hypothetical protein